MLLVVNAGSSSLKLAGFAPDLTQTAEARFERIGTGGPPDHRQALMAGLAQMPAPTAAAHRIVHGGASLTAPARLTAEVEAQIEACIPLAPLHNLANLQGVRALRALMPDLPQYASFDTAFHATNPCVATRYALPPEAEALGIRRYGFHGLSYAALVRKLQENGPETMPERLIAFHLGNGASICAIHKGRSVATTMGYSPLSGLTMGTRTGEIDGNAVLRLVETLGAPEASRILNRASGLLGLGGASDMRSLHQATTPEAAFAVDHFTYWAARHGASLTAAMGGVDAYAFTGGIGENDAQIRAAILSHLAFLGPRPTHVIAAEEERQIAREALELMA